MILFVISFNGSLYFGYTGPANHNHCDNDGVLH